MLSPIQNDMSMVFPRPTSRTPTAMSSLGACEGYYGGTRLLMATCKRFQEMLLLTVLESQNIESDMFGDIIGEIYIYMDI